MVSGWDLAEQTPARRTHLLVEAMRRAYRDRTIYLGDPDFTKVPMERLLSEQYAAGLRATIHPDKATPSDLLSGHPAPLEDRSEEHTSELQSLMRSSYAGFCLQKKTKKEMTQRNTHTHIT